MSSRRARWCRALTLFNSTDSQEKRMTKLQTIEPFAANNEPALDPFAPENLRLKQNFAETVGVKKQLVTMPVRKPGPQDFVRVRPGSDWHENFPIIELKDDREEFIVTENLVSTLLPEIVFKTLYLAVNRQGVPSFWPVRLPGPDGKDNEYWRSAREAADLATQCWVRVKANTSLGAYDVYRAEGDLGEPEWPELDFWPLIKIAFKDHLITSLDHPVVQRLRGQP
jgi:hypothetical protein